MTLFSMRKGATPLCVYAHRRMMAAFDDRTVSLDAPEQLAALGVALGVRTRLAVLQTLVRAEGPMNINEMARRVGLDASPVRGHLQALVAAGLAREVEAPTARERLFETPITNVVVTLEGARRAGRPPKGPLPKAAKRLQRKLDDVQKDMAKLEAKARAVQAEIQEALSEAPKDATTRP